MDKKVYRKEKNANRAESIESLSHKVKVRRNSMIF